MTARGRVIFTAGLVGWNPSTGEFESDDLTDQVAQTLRNIVAALAAARAEPRHLVRMTWYVTDRDSYLKARPKIGERYRDIIGRFFPAMAVVFVSALVESEAKVEIEATAVVDD